MKTYYLKIRDKFISDIKNRVKKHEYRLASPERMQAKVGDTFVLISNQNRDNFVRATIKGIKVYNSWNEALIENWEQDFKNIFTSLEATLKECYKFYSKDEVDRYGIAVFEIEPLYIDYSKSSVLLDTNIFIKRESSNKETFDLAQKLTQVKRVVKNHFDDINIFAGLLYCADCGFPITLRRVAKNRNYDFYVCSKYNRRTKIQCTAHSILKRVLNELVLEDIKRVMNEVKTHESEFIEKYRKCSAKEMRSVRLSAQTKITKAENRIKTLDDIIANLYEDNVTGKISDERFDLLAKKYEAGQTALKSEILELKKALELVNDEESNMREFLKVVNSYTEIEELTPEILNNFIDRIYIGEKYADGSAHKQEIRIIYKFIGAESTHGYKVKGSRVAEIF